MNKDGNVHFKISLHAITVLSIPLVACVFLVWVGKVWWALLMPPIILINLVKLVRHSERISFNFQTGYFTHAHVQCLISDIHALQISREEVHTDDSTKICYELNIVTKHSSRLNIIDHSERLALFSDAEALAKLLDVPLWVSLSRK